MMKTIPLAILWFALVLSGAPALAQVPSDSIADPFIWLEQVEIPRSLAWVDAHNEATRADLESDLNHEIFEREGLAILNSRERIPFGTYTGGYVYNFWQDDVHVKGLMRRVTLEEYLKKDPAWETVLDIDALNVKEGKLWVFHGATTLPPENTRCIIALSAGGQDAVVYREYDYNTRSFVEGGFYLPEAKGTVAWYDNNTLIVGTDFGEGSLTTSGYPRLLKLWKRNTPLSDAKTILEGEVSDVEVGGSVDFRPEGNTFTLYRNDSFWESTKWLVDRDNQRIEIPLPQDAEISAFFKGYLIVHLNSDWLGFPEGALLALMETDLQAKDLSAKVEILFRPDSLETIGDIRATKDYIIVSILENVIGQALYFTLADSSGVPRWKRGMMDLPDMGAIAIRSTDPFNNVVMISFENFTTPAKLFLFSDPAQEPQLIKSQPEMFEAGNLKTVQLSAVSKDGTIIPYFLISRGDLQYNSANPTLLYGYGGFRGSQTPRYSGIVGKIWLERGGVYVLSNIRGGGEFGPRWHKAALLENRQKAFDDFIAVAEDLIARKITTPEHLGIMGGSNGGLLMGAAFTQRPDLFGAVVCQVPLLDMLRYTKLPPGASWIGEFGDPDIPEQRTYIERYSPYQNLKPGVKYPQVLFVTSTKDDRVHPGHARKMAAKMESLGYKIYYIEETVGGHAAATDNIQRAHRQAMEYSYLFKMLTGAAGSNHER